MPVSTTTEKKQIIYIVGFRHDHRYVKVGKCTHDASTRLPRLCETICPRGYKKKLRLHYQELHVLASFTFPRAVNALTVEQAFHRRHREWAQCGEWYPKSRLKAIVHEIRRLHQMAIQTIPTRVLRSQSRVFTNAVETSE